MTKEVKAILVALITEMESNANMYQATRMKAYMRDRYEFFGLQKNVRAEIYKPFLAQLWKVKDVDIESVVKLLWEHPCRECQYVAMEYIAKTSKQWTPETLSLFEYMITEKSWWDTVDMVASTFVGKLFQKYPELIKPAIKKWNAQNDFWLHRTSIIFQLKYADKTDEQLLYTQCEKYIESKEFFLQKAIGWALRQHSKFQPTSVRNFVANHKLSTVSLREAKKYI